jgi:hypothetical protein
MVFAMVQTSSDTEVVGDLLWTVLANRHGDGIPLSISTKSKSVLILYVHAGFGIVDHTVIIPAPLQTVASGNCHDFAASFCKSLILIIKWCPETDLNRRHADFQSAALPTELSGRKRGQGPICLRVIREACGAVQWVLAKIRRNMSSKINI